MNKSKFPRRLPVGVQDFAQLRNTNAVYVDKTEILYNLTQNGYSHFLSRPRRFGKSLTLSTLKHLYQCDRHLFKGLWIDGVDQDGCDRWDWNNPKPVIHISLGAGKFDELGQTKEALNFQIRTNAENLGLEIQGENPAQIFRNCITQLHKKINLLSSSLMNTINPFCKS